MSLPYLEAPPYPPAPVEATAGRPYPTWPDADPVPYDHTPDRQYETPS